MDHPEQNKILIANEPIVTNQLNVHEEGEDASTQSAQIFEQEKGIRPILSEYLTYLSWWQFTNVLRPFCTRQFALISDCRDILSLRHPLNPPISQGAKTEPLTKVQPPT